MNRACSSCTSGSTEDLAFIASYNRPITNHHIAKAALHGKLNVAKCLYYFGYDIDPFFAAACIYCHVDIIKFMFSIGHAVEIEDLETACMHDNQEVNDLLIQYSLEHSDDEIINEMLAIAAKSGNNELIIQLLNSGADIDYVSTDGYTPLSWACSQQELETAELLINLGASLHTVGPDGETCLHIACHLDDIEMVELLMKHNCPYQKDNDGDYPDEVVKNKSTKQTLSKLKSIISNV